MRLPLMNSRLKSSLLLIAALTVLALMGCGRKAPPVWLEPEEFPAPSGITAHYIDGSVYMNWDYPDGLKPFIKGFVVERYKDGSLVSSPRVSDRSFQDTAATGDSYRLAAVGKRRGARAVFSPFISAPLGRLEPPSALSAEMTPDGLRLKWDAVPGVEAYSVYRDTKGNAHGDKRLGGFVNAASVVDANPEIIEGAAMLYRVRAVWMGSARGVKISAEGPASGPLEVEAEMLRPRAPTGVGIAASGGKVLVYWDESPEKWARGYRVYRSVQGGKFKSMGDSLVPAFKDNPEGSGEFAYRVHAMGPGGIEGLASAIVRLSMPGGTVLK